MKVWRVASPRFAMDRSGQGAAIYGGRWNPPGTAMLYSASSISLAALEKFVHLGGAPWPVQELVAIEFPDECLVLPPAGWEILPFSDVAQAFGTAWCSASLSMALAVPSVIVPEESNILLNPKHPDFAKVTLTNIRPFGYY